MFLYSAVTSPLDLSRRFTLHPPGRHVHSDTNLTSLGSIQPCYIWLEDYSLTFQSPSIARYSFIQLSGLKLKNAECNSRKNIE